MELNSWLIFCSIALIATITPGPAILLVTAHSLQHGTSKAIATICGNVTGLFLMSMCSVLGLSTLILYSSVAFTLLKFIGAGYLIYLGIKLWRTGIQTTSDQKTLAPTKSRHLYRQGILVALTNPKAIVFTTALFPQFIDPTGSLPLQFSILVFTFMSFSFICLLGYGIAAQRAKHKSSGLFANRIMNKLFGGIFVSAGLAMAFSSQK